MRNWVERGAGGTGVGEGAADELPPPPQPAAIRSAAIASIANSARQAGPFAGLNRLVCMVFLRKTLLMTFRVSVRRVFLRYWLKFAIWWVRQETGRWRERFFQGKPRLC